MVQKYALVSSELFSKITRRILLSEVSSTSTESIEPAASSTPEDRLFLSLQPEDFSSLSTSMTPRSLLMSVLVLLSFFSNAWSTPTCNNQCCRFVESFLVRLRKLREDYSQIRDFYEANDDLDEALLDQSVEDSFKSPFACHTMNSILEFYLSTVLPTAMAEVTEDTNDLKPHMEFLWGASASEVKKLPEDFSQVKDYYLSRGEQMILLCIVYLFHVIVNTYTSGCCVSVGHSQEILSLLCIRPTRDQYWVCLGE
ncbi:uncharacterized protein LOC121891220 [Thunnus maccoyii]|uniref:uncharacterized protein LOC121891220 n=1 Tax=Thunnus maccoyii TaxID=8240 RepID=UPI001C4DCAAC|nr:uncharacterized protein LOC121891220 [Thunnus maccoyii]